MLPPHDQFAALLQCADEQDQQPTQITALGIPTRNRPDSLIRCLRSYAECARHFERDLRYIIADDSDTEAIRNQNQANLKRLKSELEIEIQYATSADKRAFASKLSKRGGFDRATVEFALLNLDSFRTACGCSRNFLLLETAGEMMMKADDDTICRVKPSPQVNSGLALTSKFDPTQIWFIDRKDETFEPDDKFKMESLFALHEELLGHSISSCAADQPGRLNVEGASPEFFKKLQAGPARVLITTTGLAGDSGMGGSGYYLILDGPSRARLHESESVYRAALTDHLVMRAADRRTIIDGGQCMSFCLGLDNRDYLPPFLPAHRNTDGVFGALLRATAPDACFGFLPSLLFHKSPASRKIDAGDLWKDYGRTRIGDFCALLAFSLRAQPQERNTRRNLQKQGKIWVDYGSLPIDQFEEFSRKFQLEQANRLLQMLERSLARHGSQPTYSSDDVKKAQKIIKDATGDRHFAVTPDLLDVYGPEEGLRVMQRWIRQFGELMLIWTDLRETATAMREFGWQSGQRL